MAVKLYGNCVTDKGAIVGQARKLIQTNTLKKVRGTLEEMGFEYFEEQRAFALPYKDTYGNTLYATLALTVGLKSPSDKAVKKSGSKSTKTDSKITIE